MRFDKRMLLTYGITPVNLAEEELFERVKASLEGGLTLLQLRFKDHAPERQTIVAKKLVALAHDYEVPVVINDNVELCQASGADGVHLGEEDMPIAQARAALGSDKIIGATAKTLPRALAAQKEGADYLGIGALFTSSTKKDAEMMPLVMLRALTKAVDIPVVAIGGLKQDNIRHLRDTGVAGASFVSAIFGAKDSKAATESLKAELTEFLSLPPVLSIAGSDSSGGAGIQADIKAMMANGVYAMTAVTALTAQNTQGVIAVQDASPEFLADQLKSVFEDIFPKAVKIGMVSSSKLIEVIVEQLTKYNAQNIVVDPVMGSTSGSNLLRSDAVTALTSQLFPLADLITPNIPEAEVLAEMTIVSREDMEEAARKLGEKYHCAVLVKGGHGKNDANDVLYKNGTLTWFEGYRIDNPNTHGTGCTLSSAIAANLAKGYPLETSIKYAKNYLTGAIADQLDLGKGSGPLNHGYQITGYFGNTESR